MTATYVLSDAELLDKHPRATLVAPVGSCGGGLAQPAWGRCNKPGYWSLTRTWGARYVHDYCTAHAALRVRGAERLEQAAELARRQRGSA